jgi:imidazolonepropionase-like amidohydrolase
MVDIDGETRGTLAIEYVDSFLEAGYAPLEILAAMTGEAATLLGVAGDRGAIRTGMAADLVATAGDPSVDIHQLTHIDFVMKDGRIIKRP